MYSETSVYGAREGTFTALLVTAAVARHWVYETKLWKRRVLTDVPMMQRSEMQPLSTHGEFAQGDMQLRSSRNSLAQVLWASIVLRQSMKKKERNRALGQRSVLERVA